MNRTVIASTLVVLLSTATPPGEVKVVVERNDKEQARAAFAFKNVPAPARRDAGSKAKFSIVDGHGDGNSAGLEVLNDGRLPGGQDQPTANFFFAQKEDGGRLALDLGSVLEIQRVNTYSWHPNTRGPQVYKLYAADGTATGFDAAPRRATDPQQCGWQFLAAIDTRTEPGRPGGQYGVSITDAAGVLGKFRHLLFDVLATEQVDAFGNTFYSEIDVVTAADPPPEPPGAAAPARAADFTPVELTDAERKDGWKLLFDGKDLTGWHSFGRKEVRPGWQVEDGAILCADPHDAGDLCTNDQYGDFELVLDYCIAPGGNSGIMFHVTDAGGATWATGPECQLLDNKAGRDPQKAGWLYGLYDTDVDATRPAGQWNHLRLLITKDKCEHVMNGVKYFDYVLHSDDFEQRLAKSKFASMPKFAKFDAGYIALQGDHGLISFRNIKIRPIEAKK